MTLPELLPIFVYGTLKRGQVRERMWPCPPLRVEPATTQGLLYDLGPYPAMVEGQGRVAGQLWHVPPEHLAETLDVLDAIEGFTGGSDNLFVRQVVLCQTEDGRSCHAYAYLLASPSQLANASPVAPGPDGCARWPP